MSKFKILLLIIILIAVGGFVYYSIPTSNNYSSQEKEEKLGKLLGRKINLTDSKTVGDKTYSDEYISFDYPAEAEIYSYKDPGFAARKDTLATFSYDLKNPHIVFNYVATKRDTVFTLDDDSSFQLRKNPGRGYKSEKIVLDSQSAEEFKLDGNDSERSIFMMTDGQEYTLIFTGSDPARLDLLVKLLISSFKFSQK